MKTGCFSALWMVTVVLCLSPALSMAQELSVSQVDTADLILQGKIGVYAALVQPGNDSAAEPLLADFQLKEVRPDGSLVPIALTAIHPGAAADQGMNILLLVDNSGSMYDPFVGGGTRMEEAKKALKSFFYQFSPRKDQVGLATFNTQLRFPAYPGAGPEELEAALSAIARPDSDNAYTELYLALADGLEQIRGLPGRRAVIVLSDGENFPFMEHSGTPNPQWGEARINPEAVVQRYQEEGVSLYGVNFADNFDPGLSRMAAQTGGKVFEARNSEELLNVYAGIRNRIAQEVLLDAAIPAGNRVRRTLRLEWQGQRAEAVFHAPLILGEPSDLAWLLPLLILALAALALLVLFVLPWSRRVKTAQIQSLEGGFTIALDPQVTVIGSSPEAHVTLAGDSGIAPSHATIVAGADGGYTLVSERTVRVNNRPVKSRVLKPGDVIRVEGQTMVFDLPPARPGAGKSGSARSGSGKTRLPEVKNPDPGRTRVDR